MPSALTTTSSQLARQVLNAARYDQRLVWRREVAKLDARFEPPPRTYGATPTSTPQPAAVVPARPRSTLFAALPVRVRRNIAQEAAEHEVEHAAIARKLRVDKSRIWTKHDAAMVVALMTRFGTGNNVPKSGADFRPFYREFPHKKQRKVRSFVKRCLADGTVNNLDWLRWLDHEEQHRLLPQWAMDYIGVARASEARTRGGGSDSDGSEY